MMFSMLAVTIAPIVFISPKIFPNTGSLENIVFAGVKSANVPIIKYAPSILANLNGNFSDTTSAHPIHKKERIKYTESRIKSVLLKIRRDSIIIFSCLVLKCITKS